MKAVFLVMIICFTSTCFCSAQCNKNGTWTSEKTEHLDTSGAIVKSKAEVATVKVAGKQITLTPPGDADQVMTGTFDKYDCHYSPDGKNGKLHIAAVLTNGKGETVHATILIETSDGKTTVLLTAKEKPERRIKLYIGSYAESK